MQSMFAAKFSFFQANLVNFIIDLANEMFCSNTIFFNEKTSCKWYSCNHLVFNSFFFSFTFKFDVYKLQFILKNKAQILYTHTMLKQRTFNDHSTDELITTHTHTYTPYILMRISVCAVLLSHRLSLLSIKLSISNVWLVYSHISLSLEQFSTV